MRKDGLNYEVLHRFAGYPSDGAWPNGGLVLDGAGEPLRHHRTRGCVQRGHPVTFSRVNGDGYRILHEFQTGNPDEREPGTGMILDTNGNLYGTVVSGGAQFGRIFTIRTDGAGYRVLRENSVHESTSSLSVVDDGVLDRTARLGGTNSQGAVFSLNTDGKPAFAFFILLGRPRKMAQFSILGRSR